jgi:molybdopterin-binding protein
LKGRVKHIAPGAVNTEVTVELPGGTEVVSIITKASAERLHLVPGMEVYAVVKASDVIRQQRRVEQEHVYPSAQYHRPGRQRTLP